MRRRVRHRRSRDRRWIGKAIKKPGALRAYVRREWGSEGFTQSGKIRLSVLRSLAQGRGKDSKRVTVKTRRRARLALTLRELNQRR